MNSLKNIPQNLWRNSSYRDTGEPCKWVPIVKVGDCLLALSDDSYWIVADEDVNVRVIRIDSPRVYPGISLLEQDMTEVLAQIEQGLEALNLPSADYKFPCKWIVLCGLNHPSEHWQLAALEWSMMMGNIGQIEVSIGKLALFGSSQHVQHTAKKLLKKHNMWNYEEMKRRKEEGA